MIRSATARLLCNVVIRLLMLANLVKSMIVSALAPVPKTVTTIIIQPEIRLRLYFTWKICWVSFIRIWRHKKCTHYVYGG